MTFIKLKFNYLIILSLKLVSFDLTKETSVFKKNIVDFNTAVKNAIPETVIKHSDFSFIKGKISYGTDFGIIFK